jgi:hypothetical protein
MERIMDDNELKRADVNRVFKEVNDNLKAGWVYPYNFIKCDYLKYGYFTISPRFSKNGKEIVVK